MSDVATALRAELVPVAAQALHEHTCGPDGQVCCWNEDEITPCAHPDNDLSGIAGAVVDALLSRVIPSDAA